MACQTNQRCLADFSGTNQAGILLNAQQANQAGIVNCSEVRQY